MPAGTSPVRLILTALLFLLFTSPARADWGDLLKLFDKADKTVSASSLSEADVIAGLKQALSHGTRSAVDFLGRKNGFLDTPRVHIPMPDSLQMVERGLRSAGQGRYADEFIATLNHAAEQAVTGATPIFVKAIKSMTIADAWNILNGPDNAATTYFRGHTSDALYKRFLPVVSRATAKVGVTSAYKRLVNELGPLGGLVDTESLDLDAYVTRRSLDGLFLILAEEEKRIRENPAARTTELLRKVFGRNGS
jgi:hypothetical protein